MRVLHLPLNIASQASVTVRALRHLGVDARGLVVSPAAIQSADELEVIPIAARPRWRRLADALRHLPYVFAAIRWADVLHWHYGTTALPFRLDLHWARALRKPGVVEFWGSDVRIPEVEARDNPYYARLGADYEYARAESAAGSRRTQELFARAGMACVISCHSLRPHLQADLFPQPYFVRQRVWLPDFAPRPPDSDNRRPLLVHSPSAPIAKGTPAVLAAVEKLQGRYAFDFRLIQNMPRPEALRVVRAADIYLDQFVLGGYGLAALEAMAFAKPVVLYVKPSLLAQYPADLPVVNATQENLAEVLASLLADGTLRREAGLRSRAYVERYHDAMAAAQQLIGIYRELLVENGR
ncbi:MAG: hypothetical protein N2439_13060 [Anaerolineae bacterium]|nr:hypothetical protein [Anaerolineae bacterium]